ncbi:hypothetical protein C8Q80DRAFT_222745 [Daedaleopsis nitida]|nr:hypothetical protein C8Q80DRAFT_222745 [Daedaleopsis nitida]
MVGCQGYALEPWSRNDSTSRGRRKVSTAVSRVDKRTCFPGATGAMTTPDTPDSHDDGSQPRVGIPTLRFTTRNVHRDTSAQWRTYYGVSSDEAHSDPRTLHTVTAASASKRESESCFEPSRASKFILHGRALDVQQISISCAASDSPGATGHTRSPRGHRARRVGLAAASEPRERISVRCRCRDVLVVHARFRVGFAPFGGDHDSSERTRRTMTLYG